MHNKKRIGWILPLLLCCCGCRGDSQAALPMLQQTYEQLQLPTVEKQSMTGTWIPYFTCERLLSEENPEAAVRAYLTCLKEKGVDTIFLHVCAFGETLYPSQYYPMAPYAAGADALQLFASACGSLGLALHGWVNPLRLQTTAYMEAQRGDSVLQDWYRDAELRKVRLMLWEGRYYLNPAAETTRAFLADVVTELLANYPLAGVHIDDYFYPTKATALDAADYAASGATDLADWRRENMTAIVRTMYEAVHKTNADAIFSISPQGNPETNYETLYADIGAWSAAGDCCDLLIPQLYFGYRNETCPFAETAAQWIAMPRAGNVQLAAGLAAYKVGAIDRFAGAGMDEWVEEQDVLWRQTEALRAEGDICGIVYYDSDAFAAT